MIVKLLYLKIHRRNLDIYICISVYRKRPFPRTKQNIFKTVETKKKTFAFKQLNNLNWIHTYIDKKIRKTLNHQTHEIIREFSHSVNGF